MARASAKRRAVLRALLSEVLAVSLLCAGRYRRHARHEPMLACEYQQYAQEAHWLAEEIAAYMRTLPAKPRFEPIAPGLVLAPLARGADAADIVAEDLIAARIAVRSCREAAACLQGQDRGTRTLFQALLAMQEAHVAGLTRMHRRLRGLEQRAPEMRLVLDRSGPGLPLIPHRPGAATDGGIRGTGDCAHLELERQGLHHHRTR